MQTHCRLKRVVSSVLVLSLQIDKGDSCEHLIVNVQEFDTSSYLFLSHGIEILEIRAKYQIPQDRAAFMGHNIFILQC